MRNLLNFILKNSTWFVFTFYVLISCMLLFDSDSYHQNVYLTSANSVSSSVYGVSNSVTGYFNLREINAQLQASNANLENEVFNLRRELAVSKGLLSDTAYSRNENRFSYVLSTVINNSTRHPRNYFTIDKGRNDGIEPGMGVVDHNGIVGIVNVVGPNTARVISLLNETQHFSVKIHKTPYVGQLSWRGSDPNIAYVEEIARHAKYRVGDTIVTSGFSTTFPANLPVGVILNRVRTSDDNYYVFKVRLTSDFKTLSTVRVIKDIYKHELDSLATFDIQTDKK
ncbi:MAG: rod shape-determining protein MreC [Clostridium sp.]|nr:rod shape-determining protein MreC [Prevotella sp.]MCM1428776.1 rod shape-determining protein MreC [Clostridium sp.]MCM1475151.1 rod shape-determining protein MreC [Muribaculaceae bacterium]